MNRSFPTPLLRKIETGRKKKATRSRTSLLTGITLADAIGGSYGSDANPTLRRSEGYCEGRQRLGPTAYPAPAAASTQEPADGALPARTHS
jgi:hypothetical protein